MLSHPHPLSEPKLNPLPPHPPQQESKRIIQIIELHPHPLLAVVVPHPHPVAVKSLMIKPPKGFCFMVYHMCTACMCYYVFFKSWLINIK